MTQVKLPIYYDCHQRMQEVIEAVNKLLSEEVACVIRYPNGGIGNRWVGRSFPRKSESLSIVSSTVEPMRIALEKNGDTWEFTKVSVYIGLDHPIDAERLSQLVSIA